MVCTEIWICQIQIIGRPAFFTLHGNGSLFFSDRLDAWQPYPLGESPCDCCHLFLWFGDSGPRPRCSWKQGDEALGNYFYEVTIVDHGNYFFGTGLHYCHLLRHPIRSPSLVNGSLRRLLRFRIQSGVVSGAVSYG